MRKRQTFSAHAKPPKKKSFFQHTTATTSHCTKTNEQLRFLSATTYCELAVHLFFFEKISVLRLHCDNPFAPIQSLYAAVLWAKPVSIRAAGSFCKVTSGRALNRGRRTESRVLFGSFCTMQKERKNVSFAESIEVLQTSNQHTTAAASHRNN